MNIAIWEGITDNFKIEILYFLVNINHKFAIYNPNIPPLPPVILCIYKNDIYCSPFIAFAKRLPVDTMNITSLVTKHGGDYCTYTEIILNYVYELPQANRKCQKKKFKKSHVLHICA